MRMFQKTNSNLIHPELSYKIIGLCFQIHNELGRFRNEKQYADAFERLLKENNIKYEREKSLSGSFDGEKSNRNIPDFIIEDKIIINLKTKRIIAKQDYFQMKRYLGSTRKQLGIIVNFRPKYLLYKRIINSEL